MVGHVVEVSVQFGVKLTILPPHHPVELPLANAHHDGRVALSLVTEGPHTVLATHRAEQIDTPQVGTRILEFDLGLLLPGKRPCSRSIAAPAADFSPRLPARRNSASSLASLSLSFLSPFMAHRRTDN